MGNLDASGSQAYAICTPPGSIYTVDDDDSTADCMLVENGAILAVGNAEQIRKYWNAYKPNVPLEMLQTPPGSIVIPGLADAHGHILEWGAKAQLPLDGCASIDDVLFRIKSYLVAHADVAQDQTRWIIGMGWNQTNWPGGGFPCADDLEREPLLRGRPILLVRVDFHTYWVSNAILSKIDNMPDEVNGGLIVRDKAGHPTGVFIDNALDLIDNVKPARTEVETVQCFEITMRDALRFGLTSIHDAAAFPDDIAFFKRMADEGRLPIKLYVMGYTSSNDYWGSQIPRLINYGLHKRLTVRSIKLIADGALGSWGAALIAPYNDRPDTQGLLRASPETLHKLAERFYEDHFQILSKPGADVNTWRPRIEHAQVFQPTDLQRIGKLGVIASVQPAQATSDIDFAETRLGQGRMRGAYAYQTLLQASPGKCLPIGSDIPVEDINPFMGFYAAIARCSPEGTSPHGPGGWYPEEKLTRTQTLRGMTRDAAYAAFAEDARGRLAPGFAADFVVLDRDIMRVPLEEILGTKVLATVVDGQVAYGSL
ncbi:amidohydrolase 3 [Russula aff. rugulosa BPL654]|nr:amidohydrolase 3 [Russula aff. rugulosa BPL654]